MAAVVSTTAAGVTQNPATPVSASTSRATTTQAAAVSTSAAAAVTTSSPAVAAAASSSGITSAASQAVASSVAASSIASSSIAASSPSIASSIASSSTISSTSTKRADTKTSLSTSSSSSATAILSGNSTDGSSTSGSSLSGGAIGGIAGGAAGGIILLIAAVWLWRKYKNRKDRVPPPPPRDMAYVGSTLGRGRAMSNTLGSTGGANINRASSYSTLLQARSPSMYQGHSRQPSFYATYPIATPSSSDTSPPMHPIDVESSATSGLPSGNTTPHGRPVLAINTGNPGLRRDDSSSSNEIAPPSQGRRVPSVDRLRMEAGMMGDRAPSPSSVNFPYPMGGPGQSHQMPTSSLGGPSGVPSGAPSERGSSSGGPSRPNSPHLSTNNHGTSSGGYPSPNQPSYPRMSGFGSLGAHGRPLSMNSLTSNSNRYLHVGPAGGAPHQGRPINLEMPKLLGARPDSQGDFFNGMPRMESGQMSGFDSMQSVHYASLPQGGNGGGHSRGPSKTYSERDYINDMNAHHARRIPSAQSMSGRSQTQSQFSDPRNGDRSRTVSPASHTHLSHLNNSSIPPSNLSPRTRIPSDGRMINQAIPPSGLSSHEGVADPRVVLSRDSAV